MERLFWTLAIAGILAVLASCNTAESKRAADTNSSSKPAKAKKRGNPPPSDCDGSTQITGKKYNALGSDVAVRMGPGNNFDRFVNQKASSITRSTIYISIDDTTTVFEECTKGEWSWIRVLEPDWLRESHRGWVLSKALDKGQDLGSDRYARRISSSALTPYTQKSYPKTVAKYGSRLGDIEKLRRRAAELAVDSGKCDYAVFSELSDSASTLDHLHFWVECKNQERINLDEFQIAKSSAILTQKDQAWSSDEAAAACREALKSRVVASGNEYSEHEGTSYRAPITHNVVITLNFKVTGSTGRSRSHTGKCYFEPGSTGTIEIQPKL